MIAGGKGPDIMQVAENVNVYSSKNQLMPLDDLAKSAGLDLAKRFGTIGSLYSYQDKVYAVPDRSGAMIVYYNKDPVRLEGHQGADGRLDVGRRSRRVQGADAEPGKTVGLRRRGLVARSGGASRTRTAARSSTPTGSRRRTATRSSRRSSGSVT